jgi:hypothetical protein
MKKSEQICLKSLIVVKKKTPQYLCDTEGSFF